MDEDESPVVGWESVVNDNVHPLPKVPEPKVEDAAIALAKVLVEWNDLSKEKAECKYKCVLATVEFILRGGG